MEPLLFLAHRIPYPPNKGDKIRSFHWLKHLSANYTVHLGAFVDDQADWQYSQELARWCGQVELQRLDPRKQKIRSLRGLLSDRALSFPYYYQKNMQRWVDETIAQHDIRKILVYSSPMAQYLPAAHVEQQIRVIDFVDVDSEKWRQYSLRHRGLMKWIYRREANQLLREERRIADQFDVSIFVTKEEAALFNTLSPETHAKVVSISNGVDIDFFAPDLNMQNPYPNDAPTLVFTGAMDYWANVDAVTWFATEIFPHIRAQTPRVQFYIVGANPSSEVHKLSKLAGVTVTGRVEDVRPYLQYCTCAVAPLRVARGIQNKVLEAMAMAKPVVATQDAVDGIELSGELQSAVADDPIAFANLCIATINDQARQTMGDCGRAVVEARYSWDGKLQALSDLFATTTRVKVPV